MTDTEIEEVKAYQEERAAGRAYWDAFKEYMDQKSSLPIDMRTPEVLKIPFTKMIEAQDKWNKAYETWDSIRPSTILL